jgi:hypothetical protein
MTKQNDNRYKFILKLQGDLSSLKDQLTLTIKKSFITKWYTFKDEENHQTVLLFNLCESKESLNRKYFQGEYGGAKLLTKLNIIKVEEVAHSKYDEMMLKCVKLEAISDDAIESVRLSQVKTQNMARVEAIGGMIKDEEIKESDPLLKKLKNQFLCSLMAGLVSSAEVFANNFRKSD